MIPIDQQPVIDALADQWNRRRQGSVSGRGFHYQDAVTAYIAVMGWAGLLPVQAITPEGHEDISVQLADGWIHVQAKSRRSHRGDFGLGEAVNHLVEAWVAHEERVAVQPNAQLALVLERPIHGLPTTGWGRVIAAEPVLSDALRPRLLEKINDVGRVEELIASASVIELAEPREPSVALLSERLGLPPLACVVHYENLKSLLGDLADENGERPASQPVQLFVGDVQRVLDDSTALVDLESLEAALRGGVCEVVDFRTPLLDSRFFEGVDVKPGHVVAGLPVVRPELEADVNTGLVGNYPVLIVGPSGAGKSALAWMSAYASRHQIRWYRVRRLGSPDVEPLLRLVRAARPSDKSPIGLVVDDLGRDDLQGWDVLVSEAAHLPGVKLLGVTREEDLSLVQSASACHQVRPSLDERLAARLWEELRSTDATPWEDWREPYEQSEGLLLEYGYLLTTGERLRNTITSQMDRRIAEKRDLEIRVLRIVAAADAWGAWVELDALRRILKNETDEDLQRSMARLLDEHLVREAAPSVFGGLHQVRSQHIIEASHRFGVPALHETIARVLSLLGPDGLQPFVSGVLSGEVVADKVVLESLAARLRAEPDPNTLITALQALRLVSFVRLAAGWSAILGQEKAPPSKKVVAAQFALAGITLDTFLPSIRSAITRMTETLQNDLRAQLLASLGEGGIRGVMERITDLKTATLLLAALVGVSADPGLVNLLGALGAYLEGATIEAISQFLSAARATKLDLARQFADRVGGTQAIFQRIQQERPWVRDLRMVTDDEGRVVVEGTVRYVSPSVQTDVHADVVDLCRLILICVPDAEIAACRAVDASGNTAGFGDFRIADKRIPRRNLPSDVEVAWNRTRLRAVAALLAAETLTKRLVAERALLVGAAGLLERVTDVWCRGQSLPQSITADLNELAAKVDELPPPPPSAAMHLGPLDQGEVSPPDPVDGLISGIVQAAKRLFGPSARQVGLAACVHDTLLKYTDSLIETPRWHLLSEPPDAAIESIRRALVDLHAVVAEYHYGGKAARTGYAAAARRDQSSTSLARCAELARERAERRLTGKLQRLTNKLRRKGFTAHTYRRLPQRPSGLVWPFDEVALLVELDSVIEWQLAVQALVPARNEVLEAVRTVVAAPLRSGRIVDALSGRVQSRFYPIARCLEDWKADLPLEYLDDKAAATYLQAVEALVEISAIAGGVTGQLHPIEDAALGHAAERCREAVDLLMPLATNGSTEFVQEAVAFLRTLGAQVQEQVQALGVGHPSQPAVAVAFLAPASDQLNETVNTAGLLHMALVERDVDPQGVQERLDAALQRLGSREVTTLKNQNQAPGKKGRRSKKGKSKRR